MRFTIEETEHDDEYSSKVTVEHKSDDLNIKQMVKFVKRLMKAHGWSEELVKNIVYMENGIEQETD